MSTISETRSIVCRLRSCKPDGLLMVHCLLAMLCAAGLLTFLSSVGLVRQSRCASCEDGYSRCGMWQDIRSALSFALGALLCNLIDRSTRSSTAGWEEEGEGAALAETDPAPSKHMDCLAFLW